VLETESTLKSRIRTGIAVAAMCCVNIADVSHADILHELNVSQSLLPSAPHLYALVVNDSTKTRSMKLGLGIEGNCRDGWSISGWTDARVRGAEIKLGPRAWFVLMRSTGLKDEPRRLACGAIFEALELADDRRVIRTLTTQHKSLAQKKRVFVDHLASGLFQTTLSIVQEEFSHGASETNLSGSAIQVQILVRNMNSEWRDVALSRRHLACGRGSQASWLIGRGEAQSGLSSGPMPVGPKDWVVFSQRVVVAGSVSSCEVEVTLEEFRNDEWKDVTTVRKILRPTVLAVYR
jgi:hypothetical protein